MGTKIISDTAFYYGDRENTGQYDNGCWMDVLKIPWLSRIEQSENYNIIIRTLWLEATGWSREIRNKYPHIIQIGLSDHPLSAHISRLPADKQHAYISDLEYLDGIMVLTEEERQWYSVAVPSKPVERVGLPFPFETYDRNFVSSILAFQKLQLKSPRLKGVFLSIPSQLIPYCAYWADRVDNLYIHQRKDMAEYYEMLSRCK